MLIRQFKWPDLTAIVSVINQANLASGRETETTETEISHILERYFDPQRDCFVAENQQGAIIGVGTMRHLHPPGLGLGVHAVPSPEHEETVGRALVRATDAHLLATWAVDLPPDQSIVAYRDAYEPETAKIALYADEGYRQIGSRHTLAKTLDTLPELPSKPEGVVLRPFVLPGQAKDLYEFMQSVSGEENYRSYESWRDHYHLDEAWFDAALWTLAWEDDSIVGFAICFPNIHENPWRTGWIDWIEVREDRRRLGIGRYLLEQSCHNFRQRSFGTAKARLSSDLAPVLAGILKRMGWQIQYTQLEFEKVLREA